MQEGEFNQLISIRNLELAWRRITTGTNHHYKRYFREVYFAYETAIRPNIEDLHERLKGNSYVLRSPTRIYLPKPSGLQRPISLLGLEDQIVLQAVSNYFAYKLEEKRKTFEGKQVFSNIVQNASTGIFFFRDWHVTYRQFQNQIAKYYQKGLRWVASFDLAAFYDTISHELLLRTLYPRARSEYLEKIHSWLRSWSSEKATGNFDHGIPQGPIASDYLAECFLLSVDIRLARSAAYVRYVDDMRLFGRDEYELRRAVIKLEIYCRERGLIPQVKKYSIARVKSLTEAIGMLPSLGPPEGEGDEERTIALSKKKAVSVFKSALGWSGKRKAISDKTRARYVLFRAGPSAELLRYVLWLLPKHPEHVDAFSYYLGHYKSSKRVIIRCLEVLSETPYDYVAGEMLHVIARMGEAPQIRGVIRDAISVLKDRERSFVARWGACHVLCVAERLGLGRYAEYLRFQDALLQALVAPILPDRVFSVGDIPRRMLTRSMFESAIALAEPLARRNLSNGNMGVPDTALLSQTRNVFRAVGINVIPGGPIDPLGETLAARYGIKQSSIWRRLLGGDYVHAIKLLAQADPVFYSGRSRWLGYENSFNHAVFLSIQRFLSMRALPGSVKTIDRKGQAVYFGVMLDPRKAFSTAYPHIAAGFRMANDRRNRLPGQHPYAAKGGAKNAFLKKAEQDVIVNLLRKAYSDVITLVEANP